MAERIRAAGLPAAVGPSAVTRSPYDYIYVYLTEDGPDGRHGIVSDGAEYGDDGWLVGFYPDFESEAEEGPVTLADDAVVPYLKERI